MNLMGKDDETLHGTIPAYLGCAIRIQEGGGQIAIVLWAVGIPGKDAVGIGQGEAFDAEVAAYGKKSVLFPLSGVGKPNIIVQLNYPGNVTKL